MISLHKSQLKKGNVSSGMKGEREVSHAPCCNLMKFTTLSIDRLLPWQNTSWHVCNGENTFSATTTAYPATFLTFFCFSLEGAFGLANPYLPFLFFGFFFILFYLLLPLFLPRSQIKLLGAFLLYLNYLSAKITQFGQTSFSILQLKI